MRRANRANEGPPNRKRRPGQGSGVIENVSSNDALYDDSAQSQTDRVAAVLADPVAAILVIRQANPTLATHGFGPKVGIGEDFELCRAAMTDAPHVAQFRRAVKFLAGRTRRTTLNHRRPAWSLAREVERAHERANSLPVTGRYVGCLGMFVAAALALGFRAEAIRGGPNAALNIGPELKPAGGGA